jgi:hypothetical protein
MRCCLLYLDSALVVRAVLFSSNSSFQNSRVRFCRRFFFFRSRSNLALSPCLPDTIFSFVSPMLRSGRRLGAVLFRSVAPRVIPSLGFFIHCGEISRQFCIAHRYGQNCSRWFDEVQVRLGRGPRPTRNRITVRTLFFCRHPCSGPSLRRLGVLAAPGQCLHQVRARADAEAARHQRVSQLVHGVFG